METAQDLGDVGSTGAQVAGQCGSVRDDARVQKVLVEASLRKRIAVNGLLRCGGWKA